MILCCMTQTRIYIYFPYSTVSKVICTSPHPEIRYPTHPYYSLWCFIHPWRKNTAYGFCFWKNIVYGFCFIWFAFKYFAYIQSFGVLHLYILHISTPQTIWQARFPLNCGFQFASPSSIKVCNQGQHTSKLIQPCQALLCIPIHIKPNTNLTYAKTFIQTNYYEQL